MPMDYTVWQSLRKAFHLLGANWHRSEQLCCVVYEHWRHSIGKREKLP